MLVLGILFVLGAFVFGSEGWIPSHRSGDAARFTALMRPFFVDEVRSGNLPLWNPHIFSGTPYVGVFQTAVFHPFGLIYFVLPLANAISVEFVLSLLVLGGSTHAWMRHAGHSTLASGFAAFAVVFGAGSFLRVAAGHLAVLETLAWTPLLWLAVEHLVRRPSLRWGLVASGVTALMALAGHPPTLYMAGAATGAHIAALALSTPIARPWWRAFGVLLAIPVAGLALSAVQVSTGLDIALQGVRHAGVDFEFATSFSMPLEGLLTLAVPELYAVPNGPKLVYWGRWGYWDTSMYVGLVALGFAIHGVIVGRGWRRDASIVLFLVFAMLAFGRYTPLYELLYEGVPGFALFRAPSKFMFFATLFAAPLIADGVDAAMRSRTKVVTMAYIAGAAALLLLAGTFWANASIGEGAGSPSLSAWLLQLADEPDPAPRELLRWQNGLLVSFGRSALIAVAMTLLFALRATSERGRWAILLLVVIGGLELVSFAHRNRFGAEVPYSEKQIAPFRAATDRIGDGRFMGLGGSNLAMQLGRHSIWGYDPVKTDRYARFMLRSQRPGGFDIADGGDGPTRYAPILRMLRTRVVMRRDGRVLGAVAALPRHLLVDEYEVVPDAAAARDAVFAAGFDPVRSVVLEQVPDPEPAVGRVAGRVRLVDEGTDHLEYEVDLEQSAILLVTDAYAEGWRARPLPGSSQSSYDVLVANSVLRAVPLAAGHHRFRMEYSPVAFRAGAWVSSGSALAFAIAFGVGFVSRRSRSAADEPGRPADTP